MRRSRPYMANVTSNVRAVERVARGSSSSYGSAWTCSTDRRRLVALVRAAVEDRHVVAAVDELADEWDAGRAGAADDEDALGHGGDAGTAEPVGAGLASGSVDSAPQVGGNVGERAVGEHEAGVGEIGRRLDDLRIPDAREGQHLVDLLHGAVELEPRHHRAGAHVDDPDPAVAVARPRR